MARGFSIMNLMNEMSREGVVTETIEKVSVFDVQPNDDNFYKNSNIEQLKNSIYAMGGIKQNLLLVRLPVGGKFKFRIIAGHRRVQACIELVQEGHEEFEYIPAVIINEDTDKDTEDALLVMTNSTQREMTDWEKVMQHMKLKEIIPKLKKRQGLDGKTRELEADYLGVSEGQISIYNTIGTRLNAWLMNVFKDGGIGISLAYEAAKLDAEEQKRLVQISIGNGRLSEDDIKQLAGSRTIKGQMKIIEEREAAEKKTDCDFYEDVQEEPDLSLTSDKKVTDSVTAEKHPAVGEICYTNNRDDVDEAVYFIFRLEDFPEDKLQELIKTFGQSQNFTIACIAAENIFDRMLPYKSDSVRVIYQSGYQIEYIHTDEIIKIPLYDFWQGFVREFEQDWKESVGNKDEMQQESVLDFDMPDKVPVADRTEITEVRFRGGYEPILVDDLIREYNSYLEIAIPEKIQNQICKYSCLLDALELLKAKLN